MDIPAGRVVDNHIMGTERGPSELPQPELLFQTEFYSVMRVHLRAGMTIPEQAATKEITVQCVSGRLDFVTMGRTRTMTTGSLLYLQPREVDALTAIEDSVVLVTKAS
ncbi:cupin domain-containing protein [Aporhodopirellula aestuarii]|uniref:Quercetin 2,3-dioxygenase C-terminal cupin domain-containing protein n=1 Tax=Aporhodopirellula aestuarii TaxID=2950107 RepID=A0ABT0U6J2_9BACT|nr:hypothetical protein [Aporhodopirellula aestuarii]MCM2372513.1 hypothetical protein [Aporhodopirellula aestuarii]